MECNEPEPDLDTGDGCALNGKWSPPPASKPLCDLNPASNIDDISTPSDLKFDQVFNFDDPEIAEKKKEIEKCLSSPESVSLEQWQALARGAGGLLADSYRRRVWPLLLGVTPDEMTEPPTLEELSTHSEYNQVVLDVNRSLKRFPPGVPLARRLALQGQLTVLILRVIIRYPRLNYYQGYHDVAITLLLVCGARAAFPLLERLSAAPGAPLAPFMQRTMRATQHRLNYMLPLLRRARPALAARLHEAQVGTMFALPWFLTWFGHSLPRYADVVRLYDYFLCAPPLMPVYLTAALVLHREQEVMASECDMAALHCLLSRLPAALPFEQLLTAAAALLAAHPPERLEPDVLALEEQEEEQRRQEEALRARRAVARAQGGASLAARLRALVPAPLRALLRRRYALAAAAALLGVCAYYRPELLAGGR